MRAPEEPSRERAGERGEDEREGDLELDSEDLVGRHESEEPEREGEKAALALGVDGEAAPDEARPEREAVLVDRVAEDPRVGERERELVGVVGVSPREEDEREDERDESRDERPAELPRPGCHHAG